MKNLSALFFLILSTLPLTVRGGGSSDGIVLPPREVRAVWLTTLSGLDWPSRPARTADGIEQQKAELRRTLDQLKAAGINVVLFQSRIRNTTAYPSAIEPYDPVFSGQAGRSPGYDPLRFAIDECHSRGMELHAWVVAFPLGSEAQQRRLGNKALPKVRPEICRKAGGQWFLDPGMPQTADYLAGICSEIVTNYDVDGIHLDYIRYPEESIPWNDRTTYKRYGGNLSLADWRRGNVTRVVQRIHAAVKAVRPWVKMSCSPVGKRADLPRQSSYGWNARDAVWQDAAAWLQEGLMDELFPMMYFDGRHFYPFAQDWKEQSAGRPVVPGLGIYFLSEKEKNWPLSVVTRQLAFIRSMRLGGAAYFRSRFLTDNVKGLYDYLRSTYNAQPALTPPMTWVDSTAPAVPKLEMSRSGYTLRLRWNEVSDTGSDTPVTYNVYSLPLDGDAAIAPRLLVSGLKTPAYDYTPALPIRLNDTFIVTSMDAYGNECAVVDGRNARSLLTTKKEPLPHVAATLEIPDTVERKDFLLISDVSGRMVCTMPFTTHADVSRLAPGIYTVRTLGERGSGQRILVFRKD